MTNTADQRPEMTMDEVTFAALNASIEAWELKLVTKDPRKIKMGRAWCPLCLLFNARGMSDDDTCYGCPVSDGGNRWCKNTPYDTAATAHRSWLVEVLFTTDSVSSARNAWRAAAQAEIDFLRSLLPKEDGQ